MIFFFLNLLQTKRIVQMEINYLHFDKKKKFIENFGPKERWHLQTMHVIDISPQTQMEVMPTGVFKISLGNRTAATVVGNCPIAKFISLSVCFSWCSAKLSLYFIVKCACISVPLNASLLGVFTLNNSIVYLSLWFLSQI